MDFGLLALLDSYSIGVFYVYGNVQKSFLWIVLVVSFQVFVVNFYQSFLFAGFTVAKVFSMAYV